MWKYVVTWILIRTITEACPPSLPEIDEYGRIVSQAYQTMEGCIRTYYDSTDKEKVFDTRKEAIDFIKRGQDNKAAGWNPIDRLSNFKLDSIPLVQYNCSHPFVSTTLMYCDNQPCNTTTCQQCGRKWKSY